MKIKTLTLAVALAVTGTMANAAQNLAIDTGLVATLATISGQADGSALNLAINNATTINASFNAISTGSLLADLDIDNTAIGAVQSGNQVIEKAKLTSGGVTSTINSTSNSTSGTTSTIVSVNNVTNNLVSAAANTSSTSASNSTNTGNTVNTLNANIADTTVTATAQASNSIANTVDSISVDFGALNTAYNVADINASVNVSAANAAGSLQWGGLGSVKTTAIGAVQSGNITVSVK